MERRVQVMCLGLIAAALLASGCATSEAVKKDEPAAVAPATAAAQPAAAGKAAQPKETGVRPQTVKEEKKAQDDNTSAAAASAQPAAAGKPNLAAALEKIYFAFDSAVLTDKAKDTLKSNFEQIRKSTGKIRIEGHCDERGSDEYNLALGERRAKAAMNYLTTLGVGADRLAVISYGKEKPADPGHDENAWGKNRRDEFMAAQ